MQIFTLSISYPVSSEDLQDYFLASSIHRRRRAETYLKDEDRARCLAAGWLLRQALSIRLATDEDLNIEEAVTHHGQPYLMNFSRLRISIAHSGPYIVCAIAEGVEGVEGTEGVGVDVEKILASQVEELPSFILSESELARYHLLPAPQRRSWLSQAWTVKEAYLKARGLGFLLDPRSFDFTQLPESWQVWRQTLPGDYYLAGCWQGDAACRVTPISMRPEDSFAMGYP